MQIRFYIFFLSALLCSMSVSAQNFIGQDKSEVKRLMAEHRKNLFIDESSVNTVFNTLKYIDRFQRQTLLYVFSDDDICLYSKWMCDYSMMNKVIADLNRDYTQSVKNTWHYTDKGKKYTISLSTGDWFFTITTRKEEKDKDR